MDGDRERWALDQPTNGIEMTEGYQIIQQVATNQQAYGRGKETHNRATFAESIASDCRKATGNEDSGTKKDRV